MHDAKLVWLKEMARQHAAHTPRPAEGGPGGDREEGERPLLLRVLHGHSAWAPGQLEGEIRRQVWTWAADIGPDLALTSLTSAAQGENGGRAQQVSMWERALARVAAARHAGQAAGRAELGNVPRRLDPGY